MAEVARDVKQMTVIDTPLQMGASLGLTKFDVLSVNGQLVYIRQPDETQVVEAMRAASCLLEPAAGDQVLVYSDLSDQPAYVIAVLSRASHTRDQTLALSESVSLVTSNDRLQINAGSVGVSATHGDFKIDQVNGIYKKVTQRADSVSLIANEVTNKFGRFIARLRDSFRLIEGLDRTQASNIDQAAEYQISLSADITKINAQHVVKVQAKKIDLG